MDKILKIHFDNFMERGILPPELKGLKDVKLFNDKEKLDLWRNNRKGIQFIHKEGHILRGAVDNILKKGKKLIVLDYKTRGYPLKEDTAEHYQDQLDIYNFLLKENGYKTEDYAYLLFYHPKTVTESGNVVFNTDLVKMKVSTENAENIINKALKILKGNMPKPAEKCQFCKWVDVCVELK